MRLLLYDNHENLFATKKGFGHIDREINVFDALEVTVSATKQNIADLKKAMYVGVPYPKRKEYQLFKIEKVNLNTTPLTLTGIDAAADDLATQTLIHDRRFTNQPLSKVLPAVFENTTWSFKQYAPDDDLETLNFYRIAAKEALDKVEKTYAVEVQFFYTVKGNKITDKHCEIHKQIGQDSHLRLVQGINVTKVDYTQDQTELYTAAMGRGAGLQNTDDAGEATGGYSRSIEFNDVVWSKANGDPVDKPAGQDYVEIPEATEKYGWLDKDGKRHPRMAKFEFQDEQDVNKLLKETYEKLLPLSEPQIQVETSVAKIGDRVNLGDDVNVVIYEPYKLTYKARVTKIEDNPDDDNLTTVTVGFSTVERQAERELDQQQQFANTQQDFNQKLDEQKEETKRKYTEIDKKASEQTQQAQQHIREVEEKIGQEIDDVKSNLKQLTEQNTSASPLQFYGSDGNIVSGIPDVAYIKSKDGNFIINSQGFNFGGRVLGGNGQLYADGIYGEKIVGYDVDGAHITGGTIDGAVITAKDYVHVVDEDGGLYAVMSASDGFSYQDWAVDNSLMRWKGSSESWSRSGGINTNSLSVSGTAYLERLVVNGMTLDAQVLNNIIYDYNQGKRLK